jgi:hypothetical protein
MERSQEGRVEELSKALGGRFRLTALVQKRIREYHVSGRAFMPSVRNLDELFNLVLNQVEEGQIQLRLPEEERGPMELFRGIGEEEEEAAGEPGEEAEAEQEASETE